MHRTLRITFLVVFTCLCAVNMAVVPFLYWRNAGDLSRIRDLEYRVQSFESALNMYHRWETRTIHHRIVTGQAGFNSAVGLNPFVLGLNSATNGAQRFSLYVMKSTGHPVGAWVSAWSPHSEMLKFDEFHVAPNPETGEVELVATPRTNEVINMDFTITVLEHHFER